MSNKASNKESKRAIIILVVMLLLLVTVIVGIFKFPIPRHFQKTMRGAFVVDGKAGAEVEFTLNIWYFDYRDRIDKIHIELDFAGEQAMGLSNFTTSHAIPRLSGDGIYGTFFAYDPALKRDIGSNFGMRKDFSACMICSEEFTCVGSENGQMSPEELIREFQWLSDISHGLIE